MKNFKVTLKWNPKSTVHVAADIPDSVLNTLISETSLKFYEIRKSSKIKKRSLSLDERFSQMSVQDSEISSSNSSSLVFASISPQNDLHHMHYMNKSTMTNFQEQGEQSTLTMDMSPSSSEQSAPLQNIAQFSNLRTAPLYSEGLSAPVTLERKTNCHLALQEIASETNSPDVMKLDSLCTAGSPLCHSPRAHLNQCLTLEQIEEEAELDAEVEYILRKEEMDKNFARTESKAFRKNSGASELSCYEIIDETGSEFEVELSVFLKAASQVNESIYEETIPSSYINHDNYIVTNLDNEISRKQTEQFEEEFSDLSLDAPTPTPASFTKTKSDCPFHDLIQSQEKKKKKRAKKKKKQKSHSKLILKTGQICQSTDIFANTDKIKKVTGKDIQDPLLSPPSRINLTEEAEVNGEFFPVLSGLINR